MKTASLTDFDELSTSGVYRWGSFSIEKIYISSISWNLTLVVVIKIIPNSKRLDENLSIYKYNLYIQVALMISRTKKENFWKYR